MSPVEISFFVKTLLMLFFPSVAEEKKQTDAQQTNKQTKKEINKSKKQTNNQALK